MAATKTVKKGSALRAKASKGKGFTEAEKAAMRQRVKELQTDDSGESALLEKIAEMEAPDRALAERLHAIIKAAAPVLVPGLWYGMPAYSRPGGKYVCFFQPARKFKTRYATLGFNDPAHLDEGGMWPVAFAIIKLGPAEEAKVSALVKKAAS